MIFLDEVHIMDRYNFSRVYNDMNRTNLASFKIWGLFDRYNVDLPFNKEVNIFIGENGLGKTTILNCLYYVLEKKYTQLESIPFHQIEITFRDSPSVSITRADVIAYNQKRNKHNSLYDEEYFDFLLSELRISSNNWDSLSPEDFELLVHRYADMHGVPTSIANKRVINMIDTYSSGYRRKNVKGDGRKVQELSKVLNEKLRERIIYLPTYRRIENDFSNLNIRSTDFNNSEVLIRFGMADVQQNIDTILSQIRTHAMEGFNKMTGLLLEQYKEKSNTSYDYSTIDPKIVNIVLNRLGDKINESTKRDIIKFVTTGIIYNGNYQHLLNLLHMLVASYDQQKYYDDRINGFVNTCNKYLNDKYFEYNPSSLSLKIYTNDDTRQQFPIKLTQLSSGEKQIVSLFSKLYLEYDENSIVIIDEPELSLSITWQQLLLPDIIRSQNCKLLLTVTHSPFIFENEFDADAREIRAYMTKWQGAH